jgi:hypothetical protein
MPCLNVTQLFKVAARSKDMGVVDEVVLIEVVMASKDYVDQSCWYIRGEFIVIWLPLMGNGNDKICTSLPKLWDKSLRSGRSGLVYQIWRKSIHCNQPFSFSKPDEADFQPVGGRKHECLLGVTDGLILSKFGIEHIGQEPGKFALFGKVSVLLYAEVEIVILVFVNGLAKM